MKVVLGNKTPAKINDSEDDSSKDEEDSSKDGDKVDFDDIDEEAERLSGLHLVSHQKLGTILFNYQHKCGIPEDRQAFQNYYVQQKIDRVAETGKRKGGQRKTK